MNNSRSHRELVERRAELLTELFVDELKPEFFARASPDIRFDFLIGFKNPEGGLNTFALEVKATEKVDQTYLLIEKSKFDLLTRSNIPALLLVIDVKRNRLYLAGPAFETLPVKESGNMVSIRIKEIDEKVKEELRELVTTSLLRMIEPSACD